LKSFLTVNYLTRGHGGKITARLECPACWIILWKSQSNGTARRRRFVSKNRGTNKFTNRSSLRWGRRIVTFDGKPYTTEIVRLDKVFTDEIELAVGYQIAEKLLAEAEPDQTDEEGEL